MPLNSDFGGLKIAACVPDFEDELKSQLEDFQITYSSTRQYESYLFSLALNNLPDVLLIEIDKEGTCFELIKQIRTHILLKGIIIILLARQKDEWYDKALKTKVNDVYISPFNYDDLRERITFLVKFKLIKPKFPDLEYVSEEYKIPIAKRMFDILFSGLLILFLSPIFLIVAILVKLDSKGSVLYKSKRVGTGYKIFNFYKFRSMRMDADQQIANLSELNQYAGEDGNEKSAFVKLKNDPRVTRLGAFLRRSSLDELPQLFNILKGDMSTIGNRPLPLYEAEMLTSNEWSLRFLAPAGLTGLWQISKRGREDMSERERKKLDNFYAENYSFWFDIKILFKTIPAIFQKEKV